MRIFFIALAFSLTACAQAAPDPAPVSPFSTATRTVLEGEAAMALTHQCSRVAPGPVSETWAPTEEDLNALEAGLAPVLETHLRAAGANASPTDYYRQYAGFVIGGRRIIYLNGVLSPPPTWTHEAVQICDGDWITFGVEYDTRAGAFTQFAFNGSV